MEAQPKTVVVASRSKPAPMEIRGRKHGKYRLDSEFSPTVCCQHTWLEMLSESAEGELQNRIGPEFCGNCGATCVRDPKTDEIEDYDAVAGFFGSLKRPTAKAHERREHYQKENRPGSHRQDQRPARKERA
jgi:hypothetical protein